MPIHIPRRLLPLLLASVLLLGDALSVGAGNISSRLQGISAGEGETSDIGVIITFTDRVDPKTFRHLEGKSRRDALVRALHERAATSQSDLRRLLRELGASDINSLWSINAISCRIKPALLAKIAAQPGVGEVRPDETMGLPPFTTQAAAASEWNLAAIGAPGLWKLGLTGAGVVVASLDTGIDPNHADLAGKWRGGPGDWFDPYGQHATPYDKDGHGTAVMGLMVGGSAGGSAIGVAPGASWISAKIFSDSGIATYSRIHQAFAWALDPDGDGDTSDAPRIVNNSWGTSQVNSCQGEFQPDLALLKEAGIAVVFSAGNNGPNLSTSSSPANCSNNLAVGSSNVSGAVSSFSSRGPSPCAPSQIFPTLVAPGEQVRSAGLSGGGSHPLTYVTVDGTSFASPQVSGLLALLLEAAAFPATPVAELESALEKSADDLGTHGLDNNSGGGLVNGLAAYRRLEGLPHLTVYDPTPPENDRLLSFGNLPSGSSMSRSLTMRNSGGGQLILGALNSAALPPAYTVSGDSCSNTTLASDQSCEVTVTFMPLTAAGYSGTLTLPANDPDQNPLTISLSGTGLANSDPPLIQTNPANRSLDFGSVAPGASARLVLIISNNGQALLAISTINAVALAAPFAVAVDECSGRSLAGQQACRVEFSFSPTALQQYQANLIVGSNGGKATISLTGRGNHPPDLATPLAPSGGAEGLDPAAVTLRWRPASDPDGDSVSEKVNLREATSPGGNLWGGGTVRRFPSLPLLVGGLLLAGLAAVTMTRRSRPHRASQLLLLAVTMAAAACGGGGGGGEGAGNNPAPAASATPGTYTAGNLKAATTYSWTVITTDSHGATSESPTWQFTTR